ncbi:hypothetical protein BU25DRAFT_406300 [Macroventuria anomochaeta]|uniref:Uncharacterized protein n=1 Tax=Macroventuria anomochaeta TaxID=301207 RepID=A0ACB6SIS5_9PLEO|nr:uncharacterized protein BU25DRAFT_406300 [Macroventuria anomochaeta]KAF2633037.1 hypothetical protein BU25DRAFT_406300 [Macroventuria anomochaeta]
MQPLILLLSSALVASATHHRHENFHHARDIHLTRGVDDIVDSIKNNTNEVAGKISDAIDSVLARVESWVIPATCPWKISWPLPDTPMPTVDDVEIPQLSLFPRPDSTANTLTIYNFCDYDLFFEPHIGNTLGEIGHIPAGGKLDRPFEAAPEGSGVNLKVSKTEGDYSKPVQIEYAVSAGTVWYDISLIDCLGRTEDGLRNGDTTACAGHEAGLQMGPAKDALSFQCGAGAWCDDQAYLYEENLCKKSNPNSACSADKGMAVEFCASKRNY